MSTARQYYYHYSEQKPADSKDTIQGVKPSQLELSQVKGRWIDAINLDYCAYDYHDKMDFSKQGKWVIKFPSGDLDLDGAWDKVIQGIKKNRLWSAKVSPKTPGFPEQVICVYTPNWRNASEVKKTYEALIRLGIQPQCIVGYKRDEETRSDQELYIYDNDCQPTSFYSSFSHLESLEDKEELEEYKEEAVPALPKVVLKKFAPARILKDRQGKEIYALAKRQKDKNGEIIKDLVEENTNQTFEAFLKDVDGQIYQAYNTDDPDHPYVDEEVIITPELNEMLVYRGIIFYKSSATSGGEQTKRLNVWIPCLGLDDEYPPGMGCKNNQFHVPKLEKAYDLNFSSPDKSILPYQDFLGEDLRNRFHHFNLMLMSAELGGGFWDTGDGKVLIEHLQERGFSIQPSSVNIGDHCEDSFELPFEAKCTPEEIQFIKEKTQAFNAFFTRQGGYLHRGYCLNKPPEEASGLVHAEIHKRAQQARFASEREAQLAEYVKEDLKKYIHRIEEHKKPDSAEIDFTYKFNIFTEKQAINRKANYYLAKELLQQLEQGMKQNWPQTFFSESIKKKRLQVMQKNNLNQSSACWLRINLGIQSSELKKIIKRASAR